MKKSSKKGILEVDLYKPIYTYFKTLGYEVRSEINHCDICAIKDNELIIVELKKNLSIELLTQGVKRQKFADLVFVAVPKPQKLTSSKWKDIFHLIRRLELGLIFVNLNKNGIIEVVIEPIAFDRNRSIKQNTKKRTSILTEFKGRNQDLNTGGSTGIKLVTAYREMSIFIACCLDKFGPLSVKKLKELGTDPNKTSSILYNNFYGWFDKIEKGLYSINPNGKDQLNTYKSLKQHYYDKI